MQRSIIGAAIFLAIFVGFTLWELNELKDRPVTISGTQWECDDSRCQVRFMVQNETDDAVTAEVVITARARVEQGEGVSIQVVGQEVMTVHLGPGVSRMMGHELNVEQKPGYLAVKAVEGE